MNEDFSRITPLGRFPRLLIAADYASTLEPLIRTFEDGRLDVDFDLCTSQASAVSKLLARRYQLIIASAHFAEMNDFFLLKRSQCGEIVVPVVVTAGAIEKRSAGRALVRGAFDLIPTPPDHEQTVSAILHALWASKLKSLIASKERVVERCRQHLADYPGDRFGLQASFRSVLSAFEKTISAVEQSLLQMEEAVACLSDCAMKVEHQATTEAFARLDRLGI